MIKPRYDVQSTHSQPAAVHSPNSSRICRTLNTHRPSDEQESIRVFIRLWFSLLQSTTETKAENDDHQTGWVCVKNVWNKSSTPHRHVWCFPWASAWNVVWWFGDEDEVSIFIWNVTYLLHIFCVCPIWIWIRLRPRKHVARGVCCCFVFLPFCSDIFAICFSREATAVLEALNLRDTKCVFHFGSVFCVGAFK